MRSLTAVECLSNGIELWRDGSTIRLHSGTGVTSTTPLLLNITYASHEESNKFLFGLLKFQGFSVDEIRYFCSAFYEVLNKTSGKKNCIYIYGASSSGKTLFINIIKRVPVRFGSYTEQGGQFAFSEASY